MPEPLRAVEPEAIITGWDFSTGAVKCVAFDLHGNTVAETRLPTDLWTESGVCELNLMQLEGQARASVRAIADELRQKSLLPYWIAGGISATHHTAGRIDSRHNQVRRAMCWNDETLAEFHKIGLARLGGQQRVIERIGGPWAVRYSLSHLVKDEATLTPTEWERTVRILPHGSLAAGYLTGRFDVVSVSAAASTGIMDLRTNQWCPAMLDALESVQYRHMALHQLPRIVGDMNEPLGSLADHVALDAGIDPAQRPLVFPTSDDQAAGLVGGGAVNDGQLAIILGNSAVVNSSAKRLPQGGTLDAMKLNWGPYLWMRCYNNGAQFLDFVIGPKPNYDALEAAACTVAPGCGGVSVLPFVRSEPSRGIAKECFRWLPAEPADPGLRFRASLEALAYLIALGVREHVEAGQKIERITVSGGIARSALMGEILATVLDRPVERLVSNEGPALGAAVTALAAVEQYRRRERSIPGEFGVADAVAVLVKYRSPARPNPAWRAAYADGLRQFEASVKRLSGGRVGD
ncbi:MAG: FGGY-family carbohydrate kinase [Gemmataceae bacterium]